MGRIFESMSSWNIVNRDKVYYRNLLIVLAILFAFISGVTILNTRNLKNAIDEKTKVYVSDVSLQLSNDIEYRLKKDTNDLELIVDSLLKIKDYEKFDDLVEFLDKNIEELGFDSIVLFDNYGKYYSTQSTKYDRSALSGVHDSFNGKNGVTVLNEQSIMYSIPIYRDKKVVGVLAGVRDKKNMQSLIQTDSFSGHGVSCIIDTKGEAIISPIDTHFIHLNNIFSKSHNEKDLENIEQMKENIKNKKTGTFEFTSKDGTDVILSYNHLNSYDWVLLTLIPSNLISSETNKYIAQTFFIIACIIVLFIFILIILIKINKIHYKKLEHIAFADHVTKWMNNAAFQIKCSKLISESPPNTYSIVCLNIKNFKLINENFGTEQGNKTIKHIMWCIINNINKDELAARSDADNFFMCLKNVDMQTIRSRLSTIVNSINSYNEDIYEPYYLTIQQGVYIVDDPLLEITIIQDRAVTACRTRSEYQDGDCVFYNTMFTEQLKYEHELNDMFESSIKNGEFEVYLQPKICIQGGKIGGAEALVRWNHPHRGMISPNDFIPLFEKNGRICSLDIFVFEEVCKTISEWIESGKKQIVISVNLSRHHFKSNDSILQLKQIANKYKIPKNLIEIELTESIFFTDHGIEIVKEQIKTMHSMGFLCSLDDFGSGYSSLGLLMEFDVDTIKLDRRFFININNPKTIDIIESVVNLSKRIGAKTVAEGIETSEQMDLLRKVNCDMIQGYIYSKPLPISDFEIWMENHDLKRP